MSIRLDHTGGILGLKAATTGSITQIVLPKAGSTGQALTVESVSSGVATLAFATVGLPGGGTSGQLIRKTEASYEWFTAALLPTGGSTGQLLRRTESGYEWFTQAPALPAGGSAGQALVKTSSTDYAVSWQTIAGGGGPIGLPSTSILDCGNSLLVASSSLNLGLVTQALTTVWC